MWPGPDLPASFLFLYPRNYHIVAPSGLRVSSCQISEKITLTKRQKCEIDNPPPQKNPIADRVPEPATENKFVVRLVGPDFLDPAVLDQVSSLAVSWCRSGCLPRSDRSRPPGR